MSEEFFGTVKVYTDREFGFIARDGSRIDDFFHHAAVKASGLEPLQPGDRVAYTLEPNARHPGKFAAATIRLLSAAVVEPEPATAGIERVLGANQQ